MNKTSKKISAIKLLVISVGIILCSNTLYAKTYYLRMQTLYGENALGGQSTLDFAKKVATYTDKQVKVKVFWPGQLAKAGDAYKAVGKGIIQGLVAGSIYYGGIVPEVKAEWMPFSWKSSQEAMDIYYQKGFMRILNDAHHEHGVHQVGISFAGTMVFLTKFPVNTLDAFKGKRIRAMSAFADVVKKVGAVPTPMASSEQYMALKTGIIDGTVFPIDTIKNFKFYEVVDYALLPGIFNPVQIGIYLNQKWFRALPADLQKGIERAAREHTVLSMKWSDKYDQDGLQVAKSKNMKVIKMSETDSRTIRRLSVDGWNEVSGLCDRCKMLVDIIKKSGNN